MLTLALITKHRLMGMSLILEVFLDRPNDWTNWKFDLTISKTINKVIGIYPLRTINIITHQTVVGIFYSKPKYQRHGDSREKVRGSLLIISIYPLGKKNAYTKFHGWMMEQLLRYFSLVQRLSNLQSFCFVLKMRAKKSNNMREIWCCATNCDQQVCFHLRGSKR